MGMSTTRTGAALRVRTTSGTAKRVTDLLKIEPSRSFEIGDTLHKVRPMRAEHAMWRLDTPIDEHSLDVHLDELCRRLSPKIALLDLLVDEGYLMDWYCFVESRSLGYVELDNSLLRSLVKFPVSLSLHLYWSNEDEND